MQIKHPFATRHAMIYGSEQERIRLIWRIAYGFFSEDVVAILDQHNQGLGELMRQSRELPRESADDSFGLEIHRFTLLTEKMKHYARDKVRELRASGINIPPQEMSKDICQAIIELMFDD